MYQQVARSRTSKIEAKRPEAIFDAHFRAEVAVAFRLQNLLVGINNDFFEFTSSYEEIILFRVSFVFV